MLVPVLLVSPASLTGCHVDHAVLSASSCPLEGSINHSEVLKNASASWTVQGPVQGPPTSWKALRAQCLHFALVDLFVERSLESELVGA